MSYLKQQREARATLERIATEAPALVSRLARVHIARMARPARPKPIRSAATPKRREPAPVIAMSDRVAWRARQKELRQRGMRMVRQNVASGLWARNCLELVPSR